MAKKFRNWLTGESVTITDVRTQNDGTIVVDYKRDRPHTDEVGRQIPEHTKSKDYFDKIYIPTR